MLARVAGRETAKKRFLGTKHEQPECGGITIYRHTSTTAAVAVHAPNPGLLVLPTRFKIVGIDLHFGLRASTITQLRSRPTTATTRHTMQEPAREPPENDQRLE